MSMSDYDREIGFAGGGNISDEAEMGSEGSDEEAAYNAELDAWMLEQRQHMKSEAFVQATSDISTTSYG